MSKRYIFPEEDEHTVNHEAVFAEEMSERFAKERSVVEVLREKLGECLGSVRVDIYKGKARLRGKLNICGKEIPFDIGG